MIRSLLFPLGAVDLGRQAEAAIWRAKKPLWWSSTEANIAVPNSLAPHHCGRRQAPRPLSIDLRVGYEGICAEVSRSPFFASAFVAATLRSGVFGACLTCLQTHDPCPFSSERPLSPSRRSRKRRAERRGDTAK